MDVYKTFSIEAARSLPNLPEGHPCKNVHGHSFKITLTISGDVDSHTGFVMDFGDIDSAFKPIKDQIDHTHLNKVEGLENPSSEHLCIWIWDQLKPSLPQLSKIEIKETDATGCIYRGENSA
jgi:6-pyruvoyltetrahydropterin/6-carboxytetrahydropterin synthase